MPNLVNSRGPVQECWLNLDGHRMRYLRAGQGPPLLLVHGLLGYSFSWRFNLAALAEHASVYAPDLLGIGLSDRVPGLDCSLRAAARRVLRFLQLAGIENADVLGTSHGGGIAVMMAALEAEAGTRRMRRLILVAPVNPWSAHGRWLTAVLATTWGSFLFRRFASLLRPLHGYFLKRMYGDPGRLPPGSVEGYSRPLVIPGTEDYLLGVMRHWHAGLKELASAYACVSLTSLLIWGSRDPVVLPESAERVRQVMPNARLVMIPGAGHLPYEETPDEFNGAVLGFLRA